MKKKIENPWRKIRNDWGAISPVTKIIPNKKKNPTIKHKKRSLEKDYGE